MYGADEQSRTATGYAHHPLKMACLPISPHRLYLCVFLSYGKSGRSAGASLTVSVIAVLVMLSTPSVLPEK